MGAVKTVNPAVICRATSVYRGNNADLSIQINEILMLSYIKMIACRQMSGDGRQV
jgi:hypothetical protein